MRYANLFFFRRKQVPMLYDGDLHQHDRILSWLTSQDVFEIKNEIEEVNRKMLDKLLEENEFLAVYFCKLRFRITQTKYFCFWFNAERVCNFSRRSRSSRQRIGFGKTREHRQRNGQLGHHIRENVRCAIRTKMGRPKITIHRVL